MTGRCPVEQLRSVTSFLDVIVLCFLGEGRFMGQPLFDLTCDGSVCVFGVWNCDKGLTGYFGMQLSVGHQSVRRATERNGGKEVVMKKDRN